VFQGNRRSAASIQQGARLQVEERLLVDSSLGGSNPPPARWICWSHPPTNVIKLNFDAAVRREGFSAVACVARDETSKLFLAAGFLCDHGTVMEAEMLWKPKCEGCGKLFVYINCIFQTRHYGWKEMHWRYLKLYMGQVMLRSPQSYLWKLGEC